MAKSPNLSIIISQESKEKLKKLAMAEKRSVSQLAAIAIEEYLERREVGCAVTDNPVNPRG